MNFRPRTLLRGCVTDFAPRWLLAGLILACLSSALSAQVVTSIFEPPSAPQTAGSQCSLWLYCLNRLPNEERQIFDLQLPCRLISDSGTNDLVLNLNTNQCQVEVAIAPGGFAREEYFLDIPSEINGRVILDVSNYNQLTFFVAGQPAAAAASPPVQNPATPLPPAPAMPATPAVQPATNTALLTALIPAGTNAPAATDSAVTKFLNNHLMAYEPIYFILGSYPAAEFQFSLKYNLFNFTNHWNPLGDLYFAYTQTSYWDLLSSDPSFYDTSYKPSVFYYHPGVLAGRIMGLPVQLDLQLGAEHESNGRGGTSERSLYTGYLQPTLSLGDLNCVQLSFQPRAMYYLDLGQNNPDLPDYRGYVDLVTRITRKGTVSWQDFQLASKIRMGDYGSHPSFQFDLRFNLFEYFHFAPSLEVQYFAGYGQTLRQYNVYSHGIRAGLCLYY